jgi:hypothetical protein
MIKVENYLSEKELMLGDKKSLPINIAASFF